MTPSASILWPAIAITLGLIGLIVLAFALFRDRSRGRRRCPKCWYSMDGAPTLTCPECGKVARSEKKLHKTRWSKRRIAVALSLFISAYGAWKWPIAAQRGWTSLIPTTMLMYIAPAGDPSSSRVATFIASTSGAAPPPHSLGNSLEFAMWDRIRNGVPRWQAQAYLQRCLTRHTISVREWMDAPPEWPPDRFIPVRVADRWPTPNPIVVTFEDVEPFGKDAWCASPKDNYHVTVRFTLHDRTVFETTAIPRTKLLSIAELKRSPVQSFEIDGLVAAALNPRLVRLGDGWRLVIADRGGELGLFSGSGEWSQLDFCIGYVVRIVSQDGQEFGRCASMVTQRTVSMPRWKELTVDWTPGALRHLSRGTSGVTLFVEADADQALDAYLQWPFDARGVTHWSGSFQVRH
jgi:hypothetical protein